MATDDDTPPDPAPASDGEEAPPRTLRVFTSTRTRLATIQFLLGASVVLAAATVAVQRYLPALSDPLALRDFVTSFGLLAPIAFMLLQAAQVVLAPIPGSVLGFAAGYLFGGPAGAFYSLVGTAVGSYLAFTLSRRYGRPYVEQVVYGPTLEAFDDVCRQRGLLALFVIFLVPGLPDDVLCLAAGLTDLDVRKMVAVSVAGRLPGYLVVAYAGSNLADGNLLETAVIVALLLFVSAVGWYKRHALLVWLGTDRHPDGA